MKKSASRNTLALVALLSIGAAIPSSSHAGTFSDSLTNGLNSNYYTLDPSTAGVYTENASSSGIQLAKVQNTSGLQYIEVSLNLSALGGNVTGNFSTEIDFANAVIGPNNDQVYFGTSYANGAVFQDTYDLSSGLNVHVWDGSMVENPQPVSTNNGTFIVSRTGSTVTGTIDGTTIFSNTNSTALDAVYFVLQNQPGAAGDSSSVTFRNLSLTGANVVPEPTTWATVLAGLGLLAFCRRQQHRRRSDGAF